LIETFSKGSSKVIVFVQKRHEATLICDHPWHYGSSKALHSDMETAERHSALSAFKRGLFPVLVATDVAARGLDIPGIGLVVHYSPPDSSETYIHRCGRIGRGIGGDGIGCSVVMFGGTELTRSRLLERDVRLVFEFVKVPHEDVLRERFLAKIETEILNPTGITTTPFEKVAAEQLVLHGPRLMAAALYTLEQRKRKATWISKLSGRVGYVPLLFEDRYSQRFKSRRDVILFLRRAMSDQVGDIAKIGRVALTSRGYVVDLLEKVARDVLASAFVKESSVKVAPVGEIPHLIYNERRHRKMTIRRHSHKESSRADKSRQISSKPAAPWSSIRKRNLSHSKSPCSEEQNGSSVRNQSRTRTL